MTATTASTTAGTHRGRAALGARRLARAFGSVLEAIGSRWNDLVAAGQLGPSADTVTSRHTGARI